MMLEEMRYAYFVFSCLRTKFIIYIGIDMLIPNQKRDEKGLDSGRRSPLKVLAQKDLMNRMCMSPTCIYPSHGEILLNYCSNA